MAGLTGAVWGSSARGQNQVDIPACVPGPLTTGIRRGCGAVGDAWLVRQGNPLFLQLLNRQKLDRLGRSGLDFTPATQIAHQAATHVARVAGAFPGRGGWVFWARQTFGNRVKKRVD
ncbi:MAG: hypothetical protein N3J91_00360 [Verrucomicrobiae bacterium]|nr:hypothetical protein [Verrucomicrobiae bacterium]